MKRIILAAAVCLLVTSQVAFACSLSPIEVRQTLPDFTVAVTHRATPVAGITVQVTPEGKEEAIITAVTDESGVVEVHGLLPGKYTVYASHREVIAGKEWIEVVASPSAATKTRFNFTWANDSYQTRRMAGALTGLVPGNTGNKLMDIVHPKETVYAGVPITLRNAFTVDEYRTVSDSNGAFIIDHMPDGIYVLTIPGGMKAISGTADVTTRVIDLAAESTRDSLPLQLRDVGCYHVEFALRDN